MNFKLWMNEIICLLCESEETYDKLEINVRDFNYYRILCIMGNIIFFFVVVLFIQKKKKTMN